MTIIKAIMYWSIHCAVRHWWLCVTCEETELQREWFTCLSHVRSRWQSGDLNPSLLGPPQLTVPTVMGWRRDSGLPELPVALTDQPEWEVCRMVPCSRESCLGSSETCLLFWTSPGTCFSLSSAHFSSCLFSGTRKNVYRLTSQRCILKHSYKFWVLTPHIVLWEGFFFFPGVCK